MTEEGLERLSAFGNGSMSRRFVERSFQRIVVLFVKPVSPGACPFV